MQTGKRDEKIGRADASGREARDVVPSALLAALKDLALMPVRYNDNVIEITTSSHWDGIQRMLNARKAIDLAEAAGIQAGG